METHLETGQAKVEYALLLVLVALVVMASLLLLGPQIRQVYLQSISSLPSEQEEEATQAPFLGIMGDFLSRMREFHATYGRWPRSWGDYRFTDLGLDPAAWREAVEGIFWIPNGDKLGLANKRNDNLQIYVDDLEGNTLHVYDGWDVWCVAESGKCYYHTVAPGKEVDIKTLVIVKK